MSITISPHKEIEVNDWNISLIFVRDNANNITIKSSARRILVKSSVGGFEGITDAEWEYFNAIVKRKCE